MALLLGGCGKGTATSDDTAVDTAAAFCRYAPTLTWNNFGEGFLVHNCQGCHASTTADRHDAPDEVFFDTVDQAWEWSDRILARAAGDPPTMPPEGGVSEDDMVKLAWWLRCAEPGT